MSQSWGVCGFRNENRVGFQKWERRGWAVPGRLDPRGRPSGPRAAQGCLPAQAPHPHIQPGLWGGTPGEHRIRDLALPRCPPA